jgi:hypothetical protein
MAAAEIGLIDLAMPPLCQFAHQWPTTAPAST